VASCNLPVSQTTPGVKGKDHLDGSETVLLADQDFAAEVRGYVSVIIIVGAQTLTQVHPRLDDLPATVAPDGNPV
jgi:hypothetical protein